MPGLLHERAVDQIIELIPNTKRFGFAAAVREILEPYQLVDPWGKNWVSHVVPDAYLIDHERKTIVAYEVEDGQRVNTSKLNRYIGLAWEINEPCWGLLLIVSDRWGNMTAVDPLMLDIEQNVAAVRKRAEQTAKPQA